MAHRKYTVKQGDCISSIAYEHGFFPGTIWNNPKNSKLKQDRKDPNVLKPGDEVYIRDKEEKEESCASEQRHRFRRKGVPEKLKLVVKEDGEPISDESYILTVDGESYTGTTDHDGRIEQAISPDAKAASLAVGEGTGTRTFELKLGHINPISETSGVKIRLRNLGYDCGSSDEVIDERTKEAIKAFQREIGLDPSGQIDQETRDALVREHGC